VVLAVARDPGGLGLVDLSQLTPLDGSVVLIGILAGDRTIQPAPKQAPADYPLVRPCTVYVSRTAGEAAREIADWLEQSVPADVLARHSLIPPERAPAPLAAASLTAGRRAPREAEAASAAPRAAKRACCSPEAEDEEEATAASEKLPPEGGTPVGVPALAGAASEKLPPEGGTPAAVIEKLTLEELPPEGGTPTAEVPTADAGASWVGIAMVSAIGGAGLGLIGLAVHIGWRRVCRKKWAEGNPLSVVKS